MVARNTWDEMLTYRFNFSMYRLRNVLSFLTVYYLWVALIPKNTTAFGYSQQMMLTYVLGSALLQAFVLASQSYTIGDHINQGNLSNFLIKPMNYFLYWLAKDVGDKAMNIAFAVTELTILFLLLRPPVFLQTDPLYLLFFVVATVIAILLYFVFNLILGMIGFWSPEVWAPRFIFMVLIGFFSGGYFPIDVLPAAVASIFLALPFQYLLYFPLKIYLGQMAMHDILLGMAISLVWLIVLTLASEYLWKKGLQAYTAQGR